ncbi:MAG: sulfatase [Acidobacteriota bacterium]
MVSIPRILVILLWYSSQPLLALAGTAVPDARPNFVFILIDDLGWADLGCYGSRFHRTPNLDRLARQGMRFIHAYAACPVCSPTRASILTGKYPARLHLTDWLPGRPDQPSQKLARPLIRQALPLEEETVAEVLRSAGYKTAAIGKWHLGGKGYGPQQQGFDLNVAGDHTGTPLSYFYPFRKGHSVMPGLERGTAGEYLTDRLTREAESFLEKSQDQPFFLYLSHYAVHIPMVAKADLVGRFEAAVNPSDPQHNPIYAAMLQSVDESVGRILQKLEELGLDQRTIVFFTSDNGGLSVEEGPHTPATSNVPLRAGKGYLYEGGIREPLMVRWPGVVRPGSVCRTPVTSTDFFPTILEAAKLGPRKSVDGTSLVPLLQGRSWPSREIYWHYPHYSNQGGKPGGAIRQGRFKLIEFYEDQHVELYDLETDASEEHNLSGEKPTRAAALLKKLRTWQSDVGAQMMTLNPEYREQ